MDNDIFESIDYKAFEFVKSLGKGTHGTVILAQQKNSKKKYAIKSIKKQSFDNEKQLSLIKREVEIMASLSHPHIITVHDVCESSSRVTMTLEYASGGELFEYVNDSPGGLEEAETRRIFSQISSAVHYLHKKGIVHRDLKLENILLDSNGDAKLADFGLANLYSRDKLLFTYCGSPLYASPEIVKAEPYFGPEVDCWSLGVILYAMTFGILPFNGADINKLKRCIINGEYRMPQSTPQALRSLISQLLEPMTDQRLIMKEVIGHPWLNKIHDDDVTPSWPRYPNPHPNHAPSMATMATHIFPHVYPLLGYKFQFQGGERSFYSRPSDLTRYPDDNFNGHHFDGGHVHAESYKNHRDEDGNVSEKYLGGHSSNLGGYEHGCCQKPSFDSGDAFHDRATRTSRWPFVTDDDLEEATSSVNSDLEMEESASIPIICEVKRPKHISVCDDAMFVCDFKTSSTTCLGSTASNASVDDNLIRRTKSEPFELVLPQARASLFASFHAGNKSGDNIFREESIFEDSLTCDKSLFDAPESTDRNFSDPGSRRARKFVFGQPDSLEGTEMNAIQPQDNDDNFSVDSLDL